MGRVLGEGVLLPNLNIAIASSRYFLIEAFLQSLGVTRLIDLVIFRVLLKNNRNRSVTLHISSVPELIAKVRIVRHYVVTLAKKVANMANNSDFFLRGETVKNIQGSPFILTQAAA